MSKTNFDDIDLGRRGIEAGEINSESAAAGQVLTADGAGGAGWATRSFVSAYVGSLLVLEDAGDVAWTDIGLLAAGVPAGAKAVMLAVGLMDASGSGTLRFRPNGSSWQSTLGFSPGITAQVAEKLVLGTVVVSCGGGEIEYFLDVSGAETGYAYVALLGYWL